MMSYLKPGISILVANYNNGHYFKDCYNSLIAQTYSDWKCIIIDDYSTDDSYSFIGNLIKNDHRFELVKNNENRGVAYTKRKCIELATTQFCAFLDPDDALAPNAIEEMLQILFNNDKITLAYSNFVYCDEHLNRQKVHKNAPVPQNDKMFWNFGGKISHFAVFRRSDYLLTDGIDIYLKRAVDQDLYLKLYDLPHSTVQYVDLDLYLYRIHKGGISTNENTDLAYFWHWVVILNAAKRRGVNVEQEFYDKFSRKGKEANIVQKYYLNIIRNSFWIKLGTKLGMFNKVNWLYGK